MPAAIAEEKAVASPPLKFARPPSTKLAVLTCKVDVRTYVHSNGCKPGLWGEGGKVEGRDGENYVRQRCDLKALATCVRPSRPSFYPRPHPFSPPEKSEPLRTYTLGPKRPAGSAARGGRKYVPYLSHSSPNCATRLQPAPPTHPRLGPCFFALSFAPTLLSTALLSNHRCEPKLSTAVSSFRACKFFLPPAPGLALRAILSRLRRPAFGCASFSLTFGAQPAAARHSPCCGARPSAARLGCHLPRLPATSQTRWAARRTPARVARGGAARRTPAARRERGRGTGKGRTRS